MALFMYGIIYAFLGWCLEVIFYAFKTKRFVNRGFLHGPLVPIYGVSLVVLHVILYTIIDSFDPLTIGTIFTIYVLIVTISTLFELIGGAVLFNLFETRWWDYSSERFHYKGYISLRFSLIWGVLGSVTFIGFHLNIIKPFIDQIPYTTLLYTISVLATFILIDMIYTVKSLYNFKHLLAEFKERTHIFDITSANIRAGFPEALKSQLARFKETVSTNEQFRYVMGHVEKLRSSLGKIKDKAVSRDFDALRKITERIRSTRLYRAFPELKIPYVPKDTEDEDDG